MKFSLRITKLGEGVTPLYIVSLLSNDEKKSTCQKLIKHLRLQRYVFQSSSQFFSQGARFLFPAYQVVNLPEKLKKAGIAFTTPMNDMIHIDAISGSRIKLLLQSVAIIDKPKVEKSLAPRTYA